MSDKETVWWWNYMKEFWHKNWMKIFLFIVLLFMPALLSIFIYRCNILSCIPGEETTWLGFWASYSGTLTTVFVAIFSFESNTRLEKIENVFKNRESEYISALIGINIRLIEVHIIPLEAKLFDETKDDKFWKLNSITEEDIYRKVSRFCIQFVFQNISYSMVEHMEMEYISIYGRKFAVNGCSRFSLKGDLPVLEIIMPFFKGSEEEKDFSQFCFYFAQFKRNMNFLKIDLDAKITMTTYFEPIEEEPKDEKKKRKELEKKTENENEKLKERDIKITMQLEIEPQRDEELPANKISIKGYKINVVPKTVKGN